VRLIPVIDIQRGVVVRGVGGRRHEYRPLQSSLVRSTDPVAVADALVRHCRPAELYVADLDAVAGGEPAFATLAALNALGVDVWVDSGVRDADDAGRLADAGVGTIVVGLETVRGPAALGRVLDRVEPNRVVFSLDLRDGRPLGDASAWPNPDATAIAASAVGLGVRRVILLDLARVGVGSGAGTESLLRRLANDHPGVEFIAGGGIGGPDDVRQLADAGAAGVLVASALHDGRL
jgi:phosphoribosylformimino-5-aminoimidazole carboxamide ribotide isomerase